MNLYSTNNKKNIVSLKKAVLHSLPEDKGLYMPVAIPRLADTFIADLENHSFQAIAFEVASSLIGTYIPTLALKEIVEKAINFPAPVVMHNEEIGTLELFHGPSLAFKDFGARFMAELISHFIRGEDKKTTILVATSGDTGGAVAAGFYNTPGIEVVILYPKGKVSALQEKQLTTLGNNIQALEIEGTFDDCQAIVKEAFLDSDLNHRYNLSSANSINIARLIPQSFYYFEAYKQVKKYGKKVVVAVPSGNFGNLTAGLMAQRMGLPIAHFIAATNINRIVPEYLETGIYSPQASMATIANAMDVGAPSNFARMLDLFDQDHGVMTQHISGYSVADEENKNIIRDIYERFGYVADPHGAIGFGAIEDFQRSNAEHLGVYLETAHPSKFLNVMDEVLPDPVEIPQRLSKLSEKEKMATTLSARYSEVKNWLMSRKI